MAKETRHHPVLGRFRWDERIGSWETTLDLLPGCPIRFAIAVGVGGADWADAEPGELFDTGAAFLAWAREFEPRCREKIADDLLDVYNQSWADDDPEEGPPAHTRVEFLAAIRPCDINLFHSGSSTWEYESGDLFAGHRIWLVLDSNRSFVGKASLLG
jgi:hypothetical protein